MSMHDLERKIEEGVRILEKNTKVPRRTILRSFLLLAGAGACAPMLSREGQFNPDERYYFYDGSGFSAHVSSGELPGKDWYMGKKTLVTAMGEGRVLAARRYPDHELDGRFYPSAHVVEIEHFGGRYTAYVQLAEIFVNEFDYVGRNTIIGAGGTEQPYRSGRWSPPHIHVNYLMLKDIFNLVDRGEHFTEDSRRSNLVRLDPEAQGQKEYGLKLWNGEDLFSEFASKRKSMIDYFDSLLHKAPFLFQIELINASRNPMINLDNKKAMLFDRYVKQDAQWLTPEEKKRLAGLIREYANLRQPLTLPFVNPALDKLAGFYQKGGTATTLDGFMRQYASRLKSHRGAILR